MAIKMQKPDVTSSETSSPIDQPGKQSPLLWTLISFVVATLGAALARQLVISVWHAATGKKPPANPSNPEVDVREAVLWAILSGAVLTAVKILLPRRAANYYAKSTGQLPPGLTSSN